MDRVRIQADPMARSRPATASLLRPWLEALSPPGARGRLAILIFHRVHPRRDALFPGEMHAELFRERLQWLQSTFTVMPLAEAVAARARGTLPARALCVTFDDGYADNAQVALPILRELGLHATFFVATGFLNGGRMWNDTVIESVRRAAGPTLDLANLGLGQHSIDSDDARRGAALALLGRLKYLEPDEREAKVEAIATVAGKVLPHDLMLSSVQLRGLAAAGMGIGGHTVTHPILSRLGASRAKREIADGRDELETIVRQPVRLFAYPNGKPGVDYTAEHVSMVRELGFDAAVSTAWGAARSAHSAFELPRFTPWDTTSFKWGVRLFRNYFATPACATA